MMRYTRRSFVLIASLLLAMAAQAAQPITTDSRIKTLVYNPNEVFSITTHYGYQSNIEFGPKEVIDTISVGDRVGWQISPAGRRLFIRAQEENAHTNMTVVTNLRAYQFDLRSSGADAVFGSEQLTYVVRFFYPEENAAGSYVPSMPPVTFMPPTAPAPTTPTAAAPTSSATMAPLQTGSIPAPAAQQQPVMATPAFNYKYTFSGAQAVAPVKVFDDGKSTYFKFNGPVNPQVSVITTKGETLNIPTRTTPDGLIAVNAIAPRFSLLLSGQQVLVYNEANKVM